ncbi:Lactate dehydrogenase [Chitinophaga sp. YR573]|uniref:2-hydroxyacid dehydrogenase n=1 Tax=Chitinophaga sp. YR573 TaxID=1881040 RepID=UPI0008B1E3FD|nr:D-glycerate dehydrogenase [Chitinophaga sp. YR573]SEW44979.1 Lactate dehydrogenase [Chitinophaga sp. YR573]
MKAFITRVIPDAGLQLLQDAGITITQWTEKRDLTPEELINACQQHDALLSSGANNINAHFLNECKHLKVIALLSVGYDNVDVPEATRLNIPIGNTPGVLSGATADTAFLLMLAASRKAFYVHKKILKGEWKFFDPTTDLGIELNGKTLGIFGLGKIGFEMAKKCAGAYNMKVIYHNRQHNAEAEKALNAVKVSFDELLQQSDVLSVHTALTAETKGIFNTTAFSKMKPSSIFINTARGAIHNEEDLRAALESGAIWGAGLDVTNPEPMFADNPLLNMPNVAILPHIGSATVDTRNAMSVIAAKNVIAGLGGTKLPHIVNPEIYQDWNRITC